MSATNRGSKRSPSDFYPTPKEVIHNFLDHYQLNKEGIILEPCAGDGNFIAVLRERGYKNKIIANEKYNKHGLKLKKLGADLVLHRNYIGCGLNKFKHENVTTIITNPPYSLAQEFIEKSFELYPNATVIMLLRLAFLESKKRYSFWQKHPVNKLYVLSTRPSYTGNNKTDATAYAWFVWDKSNTQEIRVI